MKIEYTDSSKPLVWKSGAVYQRMNNKGYWLCVNAIYGGGLMLVDLAGGGSWDSGPKRRAPVTDPEEWKEVVDIKVVVG